jgi:hypothetical protein
MIPQRGDFGIKPGGGLAMRLVRWGTKSRYGHAAVVVDFNPAASPAAPVQIVEAAPGGVRMQWVKVDAFRWSTGGPLEEVLTEAARGKIVAGAWKAIRSDYDWPSVLEFIPRFVVANFKGYFADRPDDRLFCSEMVVWLYREAGITMFPSKWDDREIAPGAVSPGMLEKFCPPESGDL